MSVFTPYTYFQCPCTNDTPHKPGTSSPTASDSDSSSDDRTFDPRAPRANYSLYPLEHLLYCEDCHQIRCPRCVLDEIVTWYCPNCLFEVPSSTVKSEGNREVRLQRRRITANENSRCTRSCFQCPICVAPLVLSSIEPPAEGLGAEHATQSGPYVLNCGYCLWSSKEIGIQFEKPNGVFAQLARINNGGEPRITAKNRRKDREERRRDFPGTSVMVEEDTNETEKLEPLDPNEELDPEAQFANLKSFYQSQLAESSPVSALGFSSGDYGYGSPGTLSRIMGLYTGGTFSDKKSKSKPASMREATDALEGLQLSHPAEDESTIQRLRFEGFHSTTTTTQRGDQTNATARFLDELRPTAYLLRTKRSKRCRTCRHILSKPENKVGNVRFRIRLIALNYIPSISIRPLAPSASTLLQPLKPTQFLLTFKNPLFERVRVTLGTPSQTPGRYGSKVTVLCPQFEVGANTDVWDEALREGDGKRGSVVEKRRTGAEAKEGQNQAEAGKVWESGRNWVSVVVEVVPASFRLARLQSRNPGKGEEGKEEEAMKEDEDILEIPVFVRVEWEADSVHEEGMHGKGLGGEKEGREKRELAYWCVLGVGRIAVDA